MKTTTFYATKDLVIDGKPVKRGDALAVVQTDHPIQRVLDGVAIGSVTTEKPKSDPSPAPADDAKKK